SQIRIDPANYQRIYLLGFALFVSDDGGKNLREDLSEKIHPDCHAFVIQPGTAPPPKPPKPEDKSKQPKPPVCQRLLLGTDGGVYQSFAAGKGWDHLNRIPAGEYYRISLDDSRPIYRIAGGCRTTAIGLVQVQWLVKKGSAIQIGSRSRVQTDFM